MGSFIQSNIFGMQQTSTGNLFTEAMLAAYYKAAVLFYLWQKCVCVAVIKLFHGYVCHFQRSRNGLIFFNL